MRVLGPSFTQDLPNARLFVSSATTMSSTKAASVVLRYMPQALRGRQSERQALAIYPFSVDVWVTEQSSELSALVQFWVSLVRSTSCFRGLCYEMPSHQAAVDS